MSAQTFIDWQAFIVDDGSEDQSEETIKSFEKADPRIHYVKRGTEPKGAQTCRNIGLRLAADSKYILFFDADDVFAPFCSQQRVHYMENHPDLDFAVFPARSF